MVKERKTELVEGFRHSVPYINTHRGKTLVIRLGGEAIEHENFSSIVNDIGLLHSLEMCIRDRAKHTVWVKPEGTASLNVPLDKETQFVAIIGQFYHPDEKSDSWRL